MYTIYLQEEDVKMGLINIMPSTKMPSTQMPSTKMPSTQMPT